MTLMEKSTKKIIIVKINVKITLKKIWTLTLSNVTKLKTSSYPDCMSGDYGLDGSIKR